MPLKPVLIIEDDADLRRTLTEILVAEGFPVLGASDGSAGLDVIETGFDGLVILDLMMPVMNGWEFLERVGPRIPVLILSAQIHGAKTISAAAQLGRPIGFMSKPVRMDTLLEIVRQYCGDDLRTQAA